MSIQKNSIAHHTLAFLLSGRSTYTYKKLLRSDPNRLFKNDSLSVTLSRLHKNNYISKEGSSWKITEKGTGEIMRLSSAYITSPFNSKSQKNTIVSFDISEGDRKTRNWVRNQLKIFNYEMLQQSLWFGPGPLPREFLTRLTDLRIRKNVKIFNTKQR